MRNTVLLLSAFLVLAAAALAAEPLLVPVKVDGPVHDPANHTYWYGPFCAVSPADSLCSETLLRGFTPGSWKTSCAPLEQGRSLPG